jgi:hypothetical protein
MIIGRINRGVLGIWLTKFISDINSPVMKEMLMNPPAIKIIENGILIALRFW